MKKAWHTLSADSEIVAKIRRCLKCSPATATVLVNRRILTETDARRFLDTSLAQMRPPFDLAGMDTAVDRVFRALKLGQKILIFGDYDVDGMTATAVLLEFFRQLDANVSYYIPHRIREGYGLQPDQIEAHAVPNRIELIITADCGSNSHRAVEAAAAAGIDVIITDHHQISDDLPPAAAVVNPSRSDCCGGFEGLAGVGVAFCLLVCLRKRLRDESYWGRTPEPNLKELCDLVALGTVADMVPLRDDNRVLTAAGLDIIHTRRRPGLNALLMDSGTHTDTVDAQDIAFRLAPRLNAAGRLDHAGPGVELLTTPHPATARRLAAELGALNRQRQALEQETLQEILTLLERQPDLLRGKSLVIARSGWHEGVLGIVASRVLEIYFRPVVLISIGLQSARGSARSIPGFNIFKGLTACSAHLRNFGGHAQAAGLSLAVDRIDAFRRQFEETVAAATLPEDFFPGISIDCELDFKDISDSLMNELEALKPFGCGNPEPLFSAADVVVRSASIVGKNHRRMWLTQPGCPGQRLQAIQFNIDPTAPAPNRFKRIAFRLRRNYWKGQKTLQLVIAETMTGP